MWIMLSDGFLSIVQKDCPPGHLLVRARRKGDIESVFGRHVKVTRATDADYLYRALLPTRCVQERIAEQIGMIDYSNFKNSVEEKDLHDAYMKVWSAMAAVQRPRPYSTHYRPKKRKQNDTIQSR
jgi:hypothetical protein